MPWLNRVLGLGQPLSWRRKATTPVVVASVDVCLTAVQTAFVYLTASTDHARQCDGGSMTADAALKQIVTAAPTPTGGDPVKQLWQFRLDKAWVPVGGIAAWTIKVGFAATNDGPATTTYAATITDPGQANTVDALFTITLNTSDLTGFTFGSTWFGDAWRTDPGNRGLLSGVVLIGSHCVTVT